MPWPTPQEYNEAIQNTHLSLADEELRQGRVTLNHLGLPKAITGAFASVYQISCGQKRYALRCLLHDMPDQQLRYDRLSKAICSDLLEYTIDFEYQPRGIKIHQDYYPVVKMARVTGLNLDDYIRKHHKDRAQLILVREMLRKMGMALRADGFAHGDLQHGNVLITEEGLRLVDYDGMFVPSLAGLMSNELGHRNYQHPGRAKEHFGSYLDNFSLWVIESALTCLIEDPALYDLPAWSHEALLFRVSDFKDPLKSDTFFLLENHDLEEIRCTARRLRTILQCLPFNVPPAGTDVALAGEHPGVAAARHVQRLAQEAVAAALREAQAERERLHAEELVQHLYDQVAVRDAEKSSGSMPHATPGWLSDHLHEAGDIVRQRIGPNSTLSPGPRGSASMPEPGSAGIVCAGDEYPEAAPELPSRDYIPTLDDHLQAIEVSAVRDALLPGAAVEMLNGTPRNFGTRHTVFHLIASENQCALKWFRHSVADRQRHYEHLAEAISNMPDATRRYFLMPKFIPESVYFNGWPQSGVLTEWQTEALPLDEYLRSRGPDFDYTLLSRFRMMVVALRKAGIAHGCLEPSNILVSRDVRLTLVDYDNFYADRHSIFNPEESVSEHYRHPRFTVADFGPAADNFQSWLLDTIILCWSSARKLWHHCVDSGDALFFHFEDLKNPAKSPIFQQLRKHQRYDIASRGEFLVRCLLLAPKDIPGLTLDGAH